MSTRKSAYFRDTITGSPQEVAQVLPAQCYKPVWKDLDPYLGRVSVDARRV